MDMFEFLKSCIATQDGKILFILSLIAGAMVIDFITGTVAAKINPKIDFKSSKGINGILRKLTSIMVMMFFIPVSVLLPNESGVALLYTLYVGYLVFELTSILENMEKMGVPIKLFKNFTDKLNSKMKQE